MDLPTHVWPLPARKINGVGPKAALKLKATGIRTIGELARAPVDVLVQHFGRHYGQWLKDAANARNERPVVTGSEPKSLSRATSIRGVIAPRCQRS